MEQTPIETIGRRSPLDFLRQSKVARSISTLLLASTAYVGAYRVQEIAADPGPQYEATSYVDDKEDPVSMYYRPTLTEIQRDIFIRELKQTERFINYLAFMDYLENRIVYDPAFWEALHQCEQDDSWYASGYNKADIEHKLLFEGGLGMSTIAWDMAVEAAAKRGVILPQSALDASIEEQMQGAQAFLDENGWGWSCPRPAA